MKFPVTSAVLLVAVPLSLLLPGCSGGSLPGLPFPTPTPKPSVTATPSATPSATPTVTATTTATPRVTATARPTVTPTSTPGDATVNLTFTPSSDATFSDGKPLRGVITRFSGSNTLGVSVGSANPQASSVLTFAVLVRPTVGATNTPGDLFLPFSALIATSGNLPRYFAAQSGTVRLTALSATSATFEFKNLVYTANEGSLARGSVTINGTISGPITTQ